MERPFHFNKMTVVHMGRLLCHVTMVVYGNTISCLYDSGSIRGMVSGNTGENGRG